MAQVKPVFFDVIEPLILGDAVKATKYLSPKQVFRATRTRYGGRFARSNQNIEVTLTFGRPNYVEREFIKFCQKAHEPFPVKKVQLKLYNPKPNKLKK